MEMISVQNVLSVHWSVDYFSVIVGVITGALFACSRDLDIIGTIVLGLITAYGGGIIRDLVMDGCGIYFTSDPTLILICIAICAFVFYFRGLFARLDAVIFYADSLSIACFALAGASKAFAYDQGFLLAVMLGAITSVGGGAIRDICVGEIPGVFQESNFYAVAGLGGSFAYVLCATLGVMLPIAGIVCVSLVVFLRLLSKKFDFRTRSDMDLTPYVASGVTKVGRIVKRSSVGVFRRSKKH